MADMHDAHRKLMATNGFVEIFLRQHVPDVLRELNARSRFSLVVLPFCDRPAPLDLHYRGYFGDSERMMHLREDIVLVRPDVSLPGPLETLVKLPDQSDVIAIATVVDTNAALFDVYRLK